MSPSLVIGAFRARGVVELLRTPAGRSCASIDDVLALAQGEGWRRQAARHGLDELGARGVDGLLLVLAADGRPRLVRGGEGPRERPA